MATQVERSNLPLNPDGSPNLHRVTKDNISQFGIPEDQALDLDQMQETHPSPSTLETRMSRRAVLATLPLGIGLIVGALGRDKANQTLNHLVENLVGEVNYPTQDSLANTTTPEPTPTAESTRNPEIGKNKEIPFTYEIDGWTVVIKKQDLDGFKKILLQDEDWMNAKIYISHRTFNSGEESYVEQNFTPHVDLAKMEMYLSNQQKEALNKFYRDGIYTLPTAPITDDTFLTIETRSLNGHVNQVSHFPISLNTDSTLDSVPRSNPHLGPNRLEILFENKPGDKIPKEDIFLHGLCLNALSPVELRKIIVPKESGEDFVPTFPASETGMYLTIPEKIALQPNKYTGKEHPALIRMTKDFIAKICKIPDPAHGSDIQAILTSLESYILDNNLQILPTGSENMELMDTLSIKTFRLYDVSVSIFAQTEYEDPLSETVHAQRTLMNLIPLIFHKPYYLEKAYDSLSTAQQKEKADVILIHAISLLSYLGEKRFQTAVPSARDMLDKRSITKSPLPSEIARGDFGRN